MDLNKRLSPSPIRATGVGESFKNSISVEKNIVLRLHPEPEVEEHEFISLSH